ncbi:hypothetical protein GCM10023263_38010 [Phytohabitans rumicis]
MGEPNVSMSVLPWQSLAMAVEGTEAPAPPRESPEAGDQDKDQAGWLARWIAKDPVRAVAIGLILLQVIWRVQLASRGFLTIDDYPLASKVAESDLTPDLLLSLYSNHLMPGAQAFTWLVTDELGLVYWPYLLAMAVAQAVLGLAFYRLLRSLTPARWGVLIPLCVFLFSPLTLEAIAWWAVGANALPMQLAMVLALGAQVKYVRTRRIRHLGSLAAAVVLGLIFFEKALLVVPLVFLATACLFTTGGPVRSVIRTVRLYWPSWLVLTAISGGYLGLYLSRTESSSLREPASLNEVITFLQEMLTGTLLPGLMGGPWRWLDTGDGAPVTATAQLMRWLSAAVFIALIVITVRRSRFAVRAWTLLGLYLTIVVGLLALTRLGSEFSAVAGLVPRYVADVVPVAALCIGVALFGVRSDLPGAAGTERWTWAGLFRDRQSVLAPIAVVVASILAIGTIWTTTEFGEDWAVKYGRDYVHTAELALVAAPRDTVFLDRPVPEIVIHKLAAPYNMQSRFFAPLNPRPRFVDIAEHPSVFDDKGNIRQARVEGITNKPGPQEGCGYLVSEGQPASIPLSSEVYDWVWVVRIAYISAGDTTAVFRLGRGERQFDVRRGLNQIFFTIGGGGTEATLTLADPAITLCTNEIYIGNPIPAE